jgi:predicted dehydrogenase
MNNKVKIGVIGTGHLGSIHLKLWLNEPDIEFIGIFDADLQHAQQLGKDNNIKAFNSLDELISLCDAVTIAVPTSLHYEIALKCINKGVHCFIEKPITDKYEEAKELIELANQKKVIIQVGHVERFNPALKALKNYNLEPLFIEAHRLSQFKPRAIDVSVIHDLMIHDIDIMLWLVKSKVKHIDANGVAVLTDTPDIANARITFENGTVANLTASRITAKPMRKMRIFQKDAYISINFGKSSVEVFRLQDEDESIHEGEHTVPATMLGTIEAGLKNRNIVFEMPIVPEINAIAEEQKAFIDSVLNKAPIAVSAAEAAEALRIADLINVMVNSKKV